MGKNAEKMRSHMWKYTKYAIIYKFVQIYAKINIQNFENAIAVKYAICGFLQNMHSHIMRSHVRIYPISLNHSPEWGT